MVAQRRSPHPASRFLGRIDVLPDTGGRALPLDEPPHGSTRVVYRRTATGHTDLCVVGPRTHAYAKLAPPLALAVVVWFKPGGAASVLGLSAHHLVDRVIDLDALWGRTSAELLEALAEEATPSDAAARLEELLMARAIAEASTPAALAMRGAALLRRQPGRSVAAVAEDLGVTPRHLRRAFGDHVGLSPKQLSRILRLRAAIAAASRAAAPDWASIAVDHGYYDQPHLIGEFRRLTGQTPQQFLVGADARLSTGRVANPCT